MSRHKNTALNVRGSMYLGQTISGMTGDISGLVPSAGDSVAADTLAV